MAIVLISGVPGSGKTYYIVRRIYFKYVKRKNLFDETSLDELYDYLHLETKDSYLIISNITNLKIEHLDFDYLYNKYRDNMFTEQFIEKMREKYRVKKIIFVIDEIQNYQFSHSKSSFFHFLTIHRKLLIDVYLITQSIDNICKCIVDLAELNIKALERSKSLFSNRLRYAILVKHDTFKTYKPAKKFSLPISDKIISLYKSVNFDDNIEIDSDVNDLRSAYRNKIITYLLILFLVILFVYYQIQKTLTLDYQTRNTQNQTINSVNTINNTDVFNKQIKILK